MKRKTIAGLMVLFAFSIVAVGIHVSGCQATTERPIVASPSAMVRLFRDNPRKAAELYAGRLVTLPIRKCEFRIFNVTPPVIVSDPPPSFASSTTTGYCVVRRDGIYTGDGCDFTIVLESASHR